MDTVSEQRLSLVFPDLATKIHQMDKELEKQKILIRVVQGLRTWEEQDGLYAQGRTKPGSIVTNCPGGKSYHNFGLAVDCVPSVNGIDQKYQPDWNSNHECWKTMESVGQDLGLVAGAFWRTFVDAPHFQLNGRFPVGAPNDEVRQLFKDGGLMAIWNAFVKPPTNAA